MRSVSLDTLLSRARPVLLDGATGTELLRRGVRTELPHGLYPHIGEADERVGWFEMGARFVGGCCGTTPAHVAALKHEIEGRG